MKVDFDAMTRRFLMGESKERPSIKALVESVTGILENMRGRTQKESRQLSVAQQHLKEIKTLSRRLEERVFKLEEELQILEEKRG
tara:strand:+ start:143 stop:397 length:255 start_codon:yes stop_codon:yes gene_type:complete